MSTIGWIVAIVLVLYALGILWLVFLARGAPSIGPGHPEYENDPEVQASRGRRARNGRWS